MKRNIIYIALLAMTFSVPTSCNIDRSPETTLTDGNFWNSPSDLRLAANTLYTSLPGLPEDSDDWGIYTFTSSPSSISDGSRVAPTSTGDYSFTNIYRANNIIEKSQQVLDKGGNPTEVAWYVAEARFFRAMYYFNMFERFGGIPLILHTLKLSDPDVYAPRASREDVLKQIYADLDYAGDNLRTPDQINAAGEYGRISNTAAWAFKARVALFEGTREKFFNYGDYKTDLTLARDAARKVIDSGQHSLFTEPTTGSNGEIENNAYYDLFQLKGEGRQNRENILVHIYGEDADNNIVSNNAPRSYAEVNSNPTQALVDQYIMADGLPFSKSPLYQAPSATSTRDQYFVGRDPRMSFTIFKTGDEWEFQTPYTIPPGQFTKTGYALRKYANASDWQLQRSFTDRPIIRYAEVLLDYAEAQFELNGTISDADLDITINALRARLPQVNISNNTTPHYVSMPKLTNAFVSANGLDMRTEIRRERIVELAGEGLSYWDLIRWKTAETVMPKTLLGSYFFSEFTANPSSGWDKNVTPLDPNGYIILENASLRKFDPNKDYLWPLPTSEIAKNPKIEQNPGW